MSSVVRVWYGVALLVAVALAPAAGAQGHEDLQRAGELFAAQEYVAAQEVLLAIDAATLDEAERARLDELLDRVPEAIKASEKAAQNLADADRAYESGQWVAADRAYRAVCENEYARPADRERAALQCERIVEKKTLAEAAKPTEPIEGTGVTESETITVVQAEELLAEPPEAEAVAEPVTESVPSQSPPAGPRRLTPADELRLKAALLWQRAVAKAENLAATTRDAIDRAAFAEARKLAETALQTIEAAAHYAEPVSKYQTAKEAMLALQREVEAVREEYDTALAAKEQQEVAERIRTRRDLQEQQKAEKVAQLFSSADQLRREQRYGEAAEVYREILRIDPGNAQAGYHRQWAEDFESFAKQRRWQQDVYHQQQDALFKAEESLIPWDVDVMYPQNWLELSRRRQAHGVGMGATIEDVELNRQLGDTLPQAQFEETPFEQVIEFLKNMTRINMTVDWIDLEDNGIERDQPVTFQLANLSVRVVLDEVLAQVGGDVQLAFTVGDGLLRIATKEKLDRDKVPLIYDIRDLLVQPLRATAQESFDVTQGMGAQGGGGGGGGGGSGMFSGGRGRGAGGRGQGGQYDEAAGQALINRILDIIRQTVEPDSWRETGGGDASISELNGQLIILNTADAHRQVRDLLGQLRQTRALQISVETRFLDVTANFLEQFGVDLDFVFNSGSAGYDRAEGLLDPFTGAPVLVPRTYSQIGSYAAPPAFGQPFAPGTVPPQPYGHAAFVPPSGGIIPHIDSMTPISAQQGSLALVDPTGINTQVPGSFSQRSGYSPALNIAGSFLDNLQVDFLVRATQANSRSSIVQAPRLMLFNTQASSINVGRSRAYVGTLEPRLAEGAVGFAVPDPDYAQSGTSMWVQGVISADRRYVTLNFIVQQRGEPTFERFEVQRASGNSPGAFILLPDQSFAIIQTTVSVPDGGTVLLGGLKQVGEVEVEAGVPILSKIPILKRAFTNQTTVKDTRTLLILVKSKIIIQNEAEEEAFPTFTSTGI